MILDGEILLNIGVGIMILTVVSLIYSVIAFSHKRKKLYKKLEQEYGNIKNIMHN